jgi:hypothetical protein
MSSQTGLSGVVVPEEMTMARYYFDLHDGTQVIRDDEGTEFDSLDAAVQGAARSAAEIGTSRLVKGDLSDVVIAARDERGQQVFTVTASMKIDWHDRLP